VAQGAPGRVRVFGGELATDRPLPGLPVARTAGDGPFPFWELHTRDSDDTPVGHSPGLTPIGRLQYANGAVVTLAVHGSSSEIVVSDTGCFTLTNGDMRIAHLTPRAVDRAAVALDLIGVVLPYALHRDGAWCVHASAVETPGGVIAFVAPSGAGKSTLASACVTRGCALVADDVVVLRQRADGITVTPAGVPLRLHADTARAVGVASDEADDWGKVRVHGALAQRTSLLAAVYVLQPMRADVALTRAPRAPRAAALALLAHGKITALLGGDLGGDALSRCVTLAECAAVYDLAVPRDISQLGAVAAQVLAWHPDAVASTTVPG
jgi:hypothetical protein